MIQATALHEGGVGALLDNPPLVEHQDAVGLLDGRQAVGHDNGGSPSHQAVERLLHRYGIADLFPAEWVLDKEAGRSKRAHLEVLAERTGTPLPEILFVDDKLNHLRSVRSLGVGCGLAAWGYNGPREQALARAAGYRVLTLEGLESELFGST